MSGSGSRIDTWAKKWAANEAIWHKTYINPFLQKHYDDVTQGKTVKMLFPLCGKAVDMKWMADKGHTVVGIEGVAKACHEFFTDNNIEYTETEVPGWNGSLFKSEDGKIKLYCGDVFDFTSSLESGFTAVWDRGCYTAIYKEDREKYIKLITQDGLLDPLCRYYLESVVYDSATCLPNFIPEKEMLGAFSKFSATKLDQREYNDGLFVEKNINSLESGFTAVWDRGCYIAIDKEDREKYINLITQDGLLDPLCRYYLESFVYDPAKHPGPPNYIPEEEMLGAFSKFSATKLDQRDYNEGLFLEKDIECVIEIRRLLLS